VTHERSLSDLEAWIGSQWYPPSGGWLKARRLDQFYNLSLDREYARTPELEAARGLFRDFIEGRLDDAGVRRRIVAGYLWSEITSELPEACSWDVLVGSDWGPTDAAHARALVDRILRHAEEDPEYPMEYPQHYPVDYPALRRAFLDELFDPEQVTYFVQRPTDPALHPGDHEARFVHWHDILGEGQLFGTDDPPAHVPAVIALDRRVIAAAWWE
jgi:hypothetical protein